VGSTLGPRGNAFLYEKDSSMTGKIVPMVTKDGLTTLNSMVFEDPVEAAVHNLCIQASSFTVVNAGDGTTSTIVLAAAIASEIMKSVETSNRPQKMVREIRKQAERAIECIQQEADRSKEAVRLVAETSTNGDLELTEYVMQIVNRGSAFGSVVIERAPASPVRYKVEIQDGLLAGHGYERQRQLGLSVSADVGQNSPIYIEDPSVLCYDGNLISETQLKPILDKIHADPKKSLRLVIAAYEIGNEVCNICSGINAKYPKAKIWLHGMRDGAEVNHRWMKMQDLAAFTGARVINFGDISEDNWSLEDLGSCEKLMISTDKTFYIGKGRNDWIAKRAVQNMNAKEYAATPLDRECIDRRNAELTLGFTKLIIGGGHSAGISSRADAADDAIKAASACLRSGALPGCGASYIRAAKLANVGPELSTALRVIHHTIMDNYGWNSKESFEAGETLKIDDDGVTPGNFIELSIADSVETVSSVIKNALELASLVATLGGLSLTTDLKNMELLSLTGQALRGH
jgi:chaperonin GroEL